MSYKLTHPDSDQEIEVDRDLVSLYVTQGWQTKPGASVPPDAAPADPEVK